MTECPTCGADPCATPSFCTTCRATEKRADGKALAELTPAEKTADDWLTKFAAKSNEALAKKAAERQVAPAPNEKAIIEALARKTDVEYDRLRSEVAETLLIRVTLLDDKVRALKEAQQAAATEGPAHWAVSPAEEAIDGASLLNDLRKTLRRYIMLPPGGDVAVSLWILHAWTHDVCEISPILCLTSPTKRCGKTSLLIVLYFLTPRSELAANVSTASVFRYIEAERPTFLIDEGDSFLSANDEMRGILNSGHTKAGATVIRVQEVDGEHVTKRFSTWAPKAIALIKLPPDTLVDRSILVRLMRKPKGAAVERLRKRDSDEFKRLRARASRWAADNGIGLVDPDPAVPGTLHDRAADNWRPLLAIADLAGGDWPALAHKAALDLSGSDDDSQSLNVLLLADVRTAFGDATVMKSGDLVAKLAADAEKPWAEYSHGRPLTQRQLAKMLGQFGILSESVHQPGVVHGKGYKRAHLEPQWEAYCPAELGQNGLSQLPSTFQAGERANVDGMGTTSAFSSGRKEVSPGSKNANLAHSHAGLPACPDENGGNGGKGHSDQENGGNGAVHYPPVCCHCGSSEPAPNLVAVDGLNVWLHRGCEAGYLADDGGVPDFLRRI
jgi:putative DNA primase/helicase